jgi:hypothetical protein
MTYSIYKPEDCEAQAYLQGLEPAVQLRENGGVVAGHVQHAEALQVQVAVQGLDEQLPGGAEGVEGPGQEGDCGVKLEVHATCWSLQGLKGEARAGRM